MLCIALDTPHLPDSVIMVIRRHNDEAVIRAVPFLVWSACIIVKDADQITVLHQLLPNPPVALPLCLLQKECEQRAHWGSFPNLHFCPFHPCASTCSHKLLRQQRVYRSILPSHLFSLTTFKLSLSALLSSPVSR